MKLNDHPARIIFHLILLFASNISFAKEKSKKPENATEMDEQTDENESPFWERVYVFRSDRFARGPPKPAQQICASRARFLEDLERLEGLNKRVNAAVESYRICYQKHGYNLDEHMYNVNQFNAHVNDTYNIVRDILRKEPNEISHSELDRVIKGVDSKLGQQAFEDLGQNPGLSEPVPCCASELDYLRTEIQGSFKNGSFEFSPVGAEEVSKNMPNETTTLNPEETDERKENDTFTKPER